MKTFTSSENECLGMSGQNNWQRARCLMLGGIVEDLYKSLTSTLVPLIRHKDKAKAVSFLGAIHNLLLSFAAGEFRSVPEGQLAALLEAHGKVLGGGWRTVFC